MEGASQGDADLKELVLFANNRQQVAEAKYDLTCRKVALLEEQLAACKRSLDEARASAASEADKVRGALCCWGRGRVASGVVGDVVVAGPPPPPCRSLCSHGSLCCTR